MLNFERFLQFGMRISDVVSGLLGISTGKIPVQVIPAEVADSDIALEFDCTLVKSHNLPRNVRMYIARTVENLLNEDEKTREGVREIWIRQGKPREWVFE
jgi:hypothetical protein